jgi:hypothetical protein
MLSLAYCFHSTLHMSTYVSTAIRYGWSSTTASHTSISMKPEMIVVPHTTRQYLFAVQMRICKCCTAKREPNLNALCRNTSRTESRKIADDRMLPARKKHISCKFEHINDAAITGSSKVVQSVFATACSLCGVYSSEAMATTDCAHATY